jgi:transcriptional regulator with XRE-family HTH domain
MKTMLQKLDDLIQEKGLDQDELEQLAGLAKNRISKWKGGQGEPTASQALRMSRVLDVPLLYLVDDELNDVPPPDLTTDERFLIERLRNNGIDAGEVLDLVLRELRSGEYRAAGRTDLPFDTKSVGQPSRQNKRAKAPDVPGRKG